MRELPEVYQLLAARFESEPGTTGSLSLEDVRRFVRGHVEGLLERNPGMLMSILYRIDVAEQSVQRVLSTAPHDEIPTRLADLIIERQLEKVRTRRRFGSDPDPH